MPRVKHSRAEVERRIGLVYQMRVQGIKRAKIIQYSDENDWNVSESAVDKYIRRADDLLQAEAAIRRPLELGRAIDRLHFLFQKCIQIQDFKTALAVQRETNLLHGLHAPAKTELTGSDGGPVQLETRVLPPLPEDLLNDILEDN